MTQKLKFKTLGKTGRKVSICGFGCYRVDYRVPHHYEALKYALFNGINLIDTAPNYSDGGSEELVGNVVTEALDNDIKRDDLTIVTKAGYIQGKNLTLFKEREEAGNPYPDVVDCAPDLKHSIHPEYLRDQLTMSLDRLNMPYVDIFLLHNPEYFLTYSYTKDIEKVRKEFYARLKKAFEYLEEEVKEGRIRHYGISSNTLALSDDKHNFISLEKILEIAGSVSADNHFAVIQLPLNLHEKEAWQNKNQTENTKSVLQIAEEHDLGVLVNRPLNAIKDNQIHRLVDFKIKEDRSEEELFHLLDSIEKMETKFKEQYIDNFEEKEKKQLVAFFSLAKFLKKEYKGFHNVAHFRDSKVEYFIPRINLALNELYKKNPEIKDLSSELNEFAIYVNVVWDAIETYYAKQANEENKKVHDELKKYLDNHVEETPLSQKALLMINSLREVDCTLVGMRLKEYVDDALDAIDLDYVIDTYQFWDQ